MFAIRLKELRQSKGMTQSQLASKLGMSSRTIASYEQGVNEPSIATIKKLSELFDVTSDYLIGLTNIKTTDLTVATISNYLGLTPNTIFHLHVYQENQCKQEYSDELHRASALKQSQMLSTLNMFFDPSCDLLDSITDYLNFSATHFKNFHDDSPDALAPISDLELWDDTTKMGYSEDYDVWSKSILFSIEAELHSIRSDMTKKRHTSSFK